MGHSFAQLLGVVVAYVLSRYIKGVAYTAVMFLMGTFMGILMIKWEREDTLHESIRMWAHINGEGSLELQLIYFLYMLLRSFQSDAFL